MHVLLGSKSLARRWRERTLSTTLTTVEFIMEFVCMVIQFDVYARVFFFKLTHMPSVKYFIGEIDSGSCVLVQSVWTFKTHVRGLST